MKLSLKAALQCAAAAALLTGCANQGYYTGDTIGGPGYSGSRDPSLAAHDPLLDAPYRAEMTCVSEAPITVLQRVKEAKFACSDLGVSATMDELRDAGWRILALNIGEDAESDNHVGFPVAITLRKLF